MARDWIWVVIAYLPLIPGLILLGSHFSVLAIETIRRRPATRESERPTRSRNHEWKGC